MSVRNLLGSGVIGGGVGASFGVAGVVAAAGNGAGAAAAGIAVALVVIAGNSVTAGIVVAGTEKLERLMFGAGLLSGLAVTACVTEPLITNFRAAAAAPDMEPATTLQLETRACLPGHAQIMDRGVCHTVPQGMTLRP